MISIQHPISVSDFCTLLNAGLTQFQLKIIGEVSEFKVWSSGHAYFSLKDEEDESVINCVMWKYKYQSSGIALENGMKIVAFGKPQVYAKTGRLSFQVDMTELVGEGAWKKKYDALKIKLQADGVFDEAKKRKLPEFPRNIGVITSAQGAVIHDFQNNLSRHGFHIKFIDSRVEGQEAVSDIIKSLDTMRKQEIEVLVIMRGGGSMQSFAGFDNEMIVRKIASFPVPVIAAIGHHQDVPLAALAADVAVSTPTAAASLLGRSYEQASQLISDYKYAIFSSYETILNDTGQALEGYRSFMSKKYYEIKSKISAIESILAVFIERVQASLESRYQQVANIQHRIVSHYTDVLKNAVQRIEHISTQLQASDPRRLLSLGYSIAFRNGSVIKSVDAVQSGEEIDIIVSDGRIISAVQSKKYE